LDDAYRDGELSVLNKWTTLNGIMVDGIHPIGKGLGTGIVKYPEVIGTESNFQLRHEILDPPTLSRNGSGGTRVIHPECDHTQSRKETREKPTENRAEG